MFQSFPRLTLPAFLPAFLQAVTVRSALLFVVAFFTVVMLPWLADQLAGFDAQDSYGASSVNSDMNPHVTFETANFPVSLTHQEPNFYQ
jgi:hypothetical protein